MKKLVVFLILVLISISLLGCENKKVKEFMEKGNAAMAEKKYDEAIAAFTEAQKLDPENEEVNKSLENAKNTKEFEDKMNEGKKALEEKNFDIAVSAFERAVELFPENADAKSNLEKAKKANEFVNYIRKIQPIYAQIIELGTNWDGLRLLSSLGQVTDEQFSLQISGSFLPVSQNIKSRLEEITVEDKGLKEIHETLIKAMENQIKAASELVKIFESKDLSKLATVNQFLSDARLGEGNFFQGLESKAKEHGIDLEKFK